MIASALSSAHASMRVSESGLSRLAASLCVIPYKIGTMAMDSARARNMPNSSSGHVFSLPK